MRRRMNRLEEARIDRIMIHLVLYLGGGRRVHRRLSVRRRRILDLLWKHHNWKKICQFRKGMRSRKHCPPNSALMPRSQVELKQKIVSLKDQMILLCATVLRNPCQRLFQPLNASMYQVQHVETSTRENPK